MIGLIVLIGCTNPTSHPIVAPPALRDGDVLDTTATDIWPSTSGKPWIVSRDWIIGPNTTVTIHPGTEIIFAPFELDGKQNERPFVDVKGKIVAEGTSEQPIYFTTAFREPELGQWRGIRVTNPDEVSVFRHCVFSYGAYYDIDTVTTRGKEAQFFKGMIAIRNSSPIVERCIIMLNQDNGIFIHGENARPIIRYNIITANDASGMRADRKVVLSTIDVSYNCVADNSALSFLMGYDSTTFGVKTTVNANLDSCDIYYNIALSPEMYDPENRRFDLTSCSPCVDAGPRDLLEGSPATRIDIGSVPYVQIAGELRGVVSGTLDPSKPYRLSCNLRVSEENTLTIPAGTQIEVAGPYNIEAFGRLIIEGTADNPVRIFPSTTVDKWGGLRFFAFDTLSRRGIFVREPSIVKNAIFTDYRSIDVIHNGVRFEGVRFENGFDYGVNVRTGSQDRSDSVSFQYCDFINCGTYGIFVDSSSVMVRNTEIVWSKGRGISLKKTGNSVDITNCIVRSCSTNAMALDSFSNPNIINNILYGNGYYGISLYDNCYPIFQNNIVVNNRRYGIF